MTRLIRTVSLAAILLMLEIEGSRAQVIPPPERLAKDHPRVLLRPKGSAHSIGLDQLKALQRDAEFDKGLAALKALPRASAQALVWLLTGDEAAAEKALARLQAFENWLAFASCRAVELEMQCGHTTCAASPLGGPRSIVAACLFWPITKSGPTVRVPHKAALRPRCADSRSPPSYPRDSTPLRE